MIASSITIVLMVAGYFILATFSQAFKRVDGHNDVTLQMKRATRNISKDLKTSFFDATRVEQVPGVGGFDGDALAALTAGAGVEARQGAATDEDGAPFWQRNVIYYPIRPQGDTCVGAADADGYDDVCPHKMLLRKVVDSPPATSPMPPGVPLTDTEVLLTSLLPYLTRPSSLTLGPMLAAEPDLKFAEVVCTNLLSMRVRREPDPQYPGEIEVTLTAFNEGASDRTFNTGQAHLTGHQNVVTQVISVFPRNNQ